MLVSKKDYTIRFGVEIRCLNRKSFPDRYALTRMDGLIESFGEAHVFTKLDSYSWYCIIPIYSEDSETTMFTTHMERTGTNELTYPDEMTPIRSAVSWI